MAGKTRYYVECDVDLGGGCCQVDAIIKPPLPENLFKGLGRAVIVDRSQFVSKGAPSSTVKVKQYRDQTVVNVEVPKGKILPACKVELTQHDKDMAIRAAKGIVNVLAGLGADIRSGVPLR